MLDALEGNPPGSIQDVRRFDLRNRFCPYHGENLALKKGSHFFGIAGCEICHMFVEPFPRHDFKGVCRWACQAGLDGLALGARVDALGNKFSGLIMLGARFLQTCIGKSQAKVIFPYPQPPLTPGRGNNDEQTPTPYSLYGLPWGLAL